MLFVLGRDWLGQWVLQGDTHSEDGRDAGGAFQIDGAMMRLYRSADDGQT